MAPPSFDDIYLKHYAMLHRLAYQWCHSAAQADDLVQEVFADLWIKQGSWKVRTTMAAYLVGAMRNKLLQQMRHEGVIKRSQDVWTALGESPTLGQGPLSPDDNAEKSELVSTIGKTVLTFPPRQKMAMLLYWQDGLSIQEIAEVMEISDRVARKLVQAGVEKLRGVMSV